MRTEVGLQIPGTGIMATTGIALLQSVSDLKHPPYTREEMLEALQAQGAKTMVIQLAKMGRDPGQEACSQEIANGFKVCVESSDNSAAALAFC